jgi:hypothetical protein
LFLASGEGANGWIGFAELAFSAKLARRRVVTPGVMRATTARGSGTSGPARMRVASTPPRCGIRISKDNDPRRQVHPRRLGETAQGAFIGETLHPVGRLLTMSEQLRSVVQFDRSPTPERCLTARGLWDAVLSARAVWAHERHQPQRGSAPNARLALLDALEAYVKSLDERGHPVPYALRDELRLQRLTNVASRQVRPVTTREHHRNGRSVR